jgi:hypothetical protein
MIPYFYWQRLFSKVISVRPVSEVIPFKRHLTAISVQSETLHWPYSLLPAASTVPAFIPFVFSFTAELPPAETTSTKYQSETASRHSQVGQPTLPPISGFAHCVSTDRTMLMLKKPSPRTSALR